MRVVDYKQTKSKQEVIAFIEAAKDDSIYEVIVRGDKSNCKVLRGVEVYIDNELIYKVNTEEGTYWSKYVGNFYLSKGEGWYLSKYFENYAEGGVTPSWWAQAEKNIRRHSDPLYNFRAAVEAGCDIAVKFME